MYQTLSVLAKEIDPSIFQKRLSSFTQLWMPIESDFVKYSCNTIRAEFITWQLQKSGRSVTVILVMEIQTLRCTLNGAAIQFACTCTCTQTFHYIYSFHNQLKTVHLNGKVNRRVDFLIHHLLEYEKDAFIRYKSARQLPPVINKKVKEEQSRHQRGPSKMVKVSAHIQACIYNKGTSKLTYSAKKYKRMDCGEHVWL